MPFVEAARTHVALERPQLKAVGPFALGDIEQREADAAACPARRHVELIDVVAVERQDPTTTTSPSVATHASR